MKFLRAILRNLVIIGICFLIFFLEGYLSNTNSWKDIRQHTFDYIFMILGFITASEATLFVDKRYNGIFIRHGKSRKNRANKIILIVTVYIFIFSVFILIYHEDLRNEKTSVLIIVFAAIYVIMFDLIQLTKSYHKNLQREKDTNARLKEEKLLSDLKALQNQVNPHFLFNSLNVLVSEIYFNQEKAVKYTQHLSDIYRYVLQSTESYTVKLKQELNFLQSYIYMYKTKYNEGFQVVINIDENLLNFEIPPLALQTLVENSLKHNAILPGQPLIVKIDSHNTYITVCNNITKKKTVFSDETGLKNLGTRYKLLSNKDIDIEQTETEYKVTVPLL